MLKFHIYVFVVYIFSGGSFEVQTISLYSNSKNTFKQLLSSFVLFINERNWVFATNSNLLIPISLQPDGVGLYYFKLTLFDLTEFIVEISKVYNIGLQRY